MGLRFVIGRSGTGKTTLFLEELAKKQQLNENGNLIYIVPEQYSLQAERDLIEKTSGQGIMRAAVLSFQRLAFPVFSEKGGSGKALLNDTGKVMVLRKAILAQEKNLEYFKKAVDKQGFMEKLSLTISEFFQYNVTLEQITGLSKSELNQSAMGNKLADLAVIYESYLSFLQKDYLSNDELLDVLASKMEGAAFFEQSEVWVDGFYGFTPQELNVLEKLLKSAKSVSIALTMDEYSYKKKDLSMSAPFFEPSETVKKLTAIVENNSIILEPPVFLNEKFRFLSLEMKELEKEFFFYHTKGCEFSKNVRIFSAGNRYSEVEDTARQIIRLVEEEGFRFRDIAIVTKALGEYEKNCKGILKEYEIPFFIDAKREITSHPLIGIVKGAVETLAYDFSYESVFRYLKTGLTGMHPDDIDKLENYVLCYGIKGYRWKREWEYGFRKKPDEQKKSEINELRIELLKPFEAHFAELTKNQKLTVKEITTRLCKMLEMLSVPVCLQNWIEERSQSNDMTRAYEHKRCWGILTDVFDKMVEILGEESVTISEYLKIISAGLDSCDMGILPPGLDQVIVGDIERTRLPSIKALFVLGVNDGILPSIMEDQGIFTEQERELLEKKGVELFHNSKRRLFEEQYLIYRGITKPQQKLQLSYSTGDLNGKAMRPSVLIGKIKKIFPEILEVKEEGLEEIEYISKPGPALHRLGAKIRLFGQGEEPEGVWKDAISFYLASSFWSEKLKMLAYGLTDKNQEKHLSLLGVEKLYGRQIHTSVSRLEKFVACPFSYFVQYGLKAKERPLYQINSPDLGTLFHGVLELFSQNLQKEAKEWKKLSRKETEEMIEAAVDEIAPEMGNEILLSTSSHKYLIQRLKRISKRAVWTLTEHIKKGTFEPLGFEIGFGRGEKLPSIVVLLSNGEKMFLDGKIDRVDIWDNQGNKYIKIIDYKSGNKSFSLQEIYYGLQLQLMLYMHAFLENGDKMADGSLFPGGVFYFRINDPMLNSVRTLSEEEIELLLSKELKMSGLVLLDEDVIKALDMGFVTEDGAGLNKVSSDIIPIGVTTKGELKKESSVVDRLRFSALMQFAENKARDIGDDITRGNIEINPYKNKQIIPCGYCEFKPICRFDTASQENSFRLLKPFPKEELWEKITKEIDNKALAEIEEAVCTDDE